MNSLLLALLSLLPLSSLALQCLHNSTVTNSAYYNGMLVRASSNTYNLGVLECADGLTRCVTFQPMDISFFKSLDAAKDNSIFVSLISGNNGKVVGRGCMSEEDTNKIKAQEAEECTGKPNFDCFCLTDECTGASGVSMGLLSLVTVLVYWIAN